MRPRLTVASGRTRWRRKSSNWSIGDWKCAPGLSIPEVGNQPSPAAKMMISGIPITKYGIEYSTRLTPLPIRSTFPPRFQPACEPSARPTTIAISSANPMRMIVGQKRDSDDLDHRLAAELERVAQVAGGRRLRRSR